jgi:hypothetical protein
MMFVPHSKHMPPRLVTGIALLIYIILSVFSGPQRLGLSLPIWAKRMDILPEDGDKSSVFSKQLQIIIRLTDNVLKTGH